MKIVALDVGDVWTGTAISDALGMFARPFQTVQTNNLAPFLSDLIKKESLSIIVIGYPKTLKGTKSAQTLKLEEQAAQLKTEFPSITWVFWDERFSSKQAEQLKKTKTKEDKIHSHSIAAAFILSSYLEYRHLQSPTE